MITTHLNRLFNISYPKPQFKHQILGWSFFVGIVIYIFLVAFQPFGTYNYHHVNKYWLLLPYALFSIVCFAVSDFVEFKKQRKYSWNIKSEMIKILLVLLTSSVFNYFYNAFFISKSTITWYGWIEMFVYTLLLGIPVCMLYFLGRYISLSRKIEEELIAEKQFVNQNNDVVLELKTDLINEQLSLKSKDFIMAQSEGNYCTVYFIQDNKIQQKILRISLKSLEEQITSDKIKRCHRSFIFNADYIVKVKGNAQGYKITLRGIDEIIPVSRKYLKVVEDYKQNRKANETTR